MLQRDGRYKKLRTTYNEPGHAHELTFSCYCKLPLLNKDRTRQWFVEALNRARKKHDFDLWAYVIMPEHVHVLINPNRDDYSIAKIRQAIKQPVAQRAIRFLRGNAMPFLSQLRVEQPGGGVVYCFWQPGGGYDRNIRKARTAWASVAYIHNNPVGRGLARRPEDWKWSSARWYAGMDDVPLAMDDRPPDPEL